MRNLMIKLLLFICIFSLPVDCIDADIVKPSLSASSFIAIEPDSGRIIVSRDSNAKKYMASTTKIMTTIVAIEELKDLNKEVLIPAECTNIEGSSVYLIPNQKVKLIDLLYGVMLRSGNDAASAVAYYAGDKNIDNFIEKMNEKAEQIGALNTHFVNPHGLHNDEHYTTAYDLALITKYAMNNPLFRKIASTKRYINEGNNFYFFNKNKVVYQYKYGTGVKIGYTRAAGRCLVASAEKDDVEIIVVVLNDSNWFSDSYKVFDYAFSQLKRYKLMDRGQFITKNDEGNPVFVSKEISLVLSEDEVTDIKIEVIKKIDYYDTELKKRVFGICNIKLKDKILEKVKLVY